MKRVGHDSTGEEDAKKKLEGMNVKGNAEENVGENDGENEEENVEKGWERN